MPAVVQGGAWNIRTSRTRQADLEVLKSSVNADYMVPIVLDASTVAPATDGVRRLKAGTLLSKNVNNQYERFTGAAGQVVRGVLATTHEFPDNLAHSDAQSQMWNHGQVFRVDRIVDWATAGIAAAARAALPTCRFD
jgi:hypothetical protein